MMTAVETYAALVDAQFDELFAATPEGFRPLWQPATRELLITWDKEQKL